MLQIQCPSCTRDLNMPESMLGRQVRCPLCSHVFQMAGSDEAAQPPAPSPASPAPADGGRFDYYPSEPRASARPRDYADHDEEDRYELRARVGQGRTGAAIWLLISGVLDLLLLFVFYFFVFTIDRRPPPGEVVAIISVIALVFYVVPLVFVFIAAGVIRTARGSGLIITGSVTAFVIAFEQLIMTGIFTFGTIVELSNRWRQDRFPIAVPLVLVFSLAGLIISIIAGIKALIAVARSAPRRRARYYN